MKKLMMCLIWVFVSDWGWAQGTFSSWADRNYPKDVNYGYILYNNFVPGLIDAPVFDTDCQTRLAGTAYSAQVYVGFTPTSLEPLGPITWFRTGSAAGYIVPVSFTVPGAADLQTVYTQLRVWQAAAVKTFEEAAAAGGKIGSANIVPMQVVYPTPPPNNPLGLESFCLIPEPSVTALLGSAASIAAACVILRRLSESGMWAAE
jgi:hypothetical protein